jgi:hypothetical protein
MDALEFVRERNRMCDSFGHISCGNCPAEKHGECVAILWDEEIVPIVEKWSKEHPRKTRQDAFLEQYPDAPLSYGIINIKPCQVVKNHTYGSCSITDCPLCRKEFWSQEVD